MHIALLFAALAARAAASEPSEGCHHPNQLGKTRCTSDAKVEQFCDPYTKVWTTLVDCAADAKIPNCKCASWADAATTAGYNQCRKDGDPQAEPCGVPAK